MLEKLHISNFQSHLDSELDFHPGVNAIIGPTDNGKSAVLRALRWVCFNQPTGTGFIRHGEKEALVSIKVSGSPPICRSRGKSGKAGYYRLGEQEFEALGQGAPPEEIQAALKMSPEFNLQRQFDPHFLISSNPGDAGRLINRVADLEIIDRSIKAGNSDVLSIKGAIQTATLDIDKWKDQAEALSSVQDLADQLENLQDRDSKLDRTLEKKETILRLAQGIKQGTSQFNQLESRLNPLIKRLQRAEETSLILGKKETELGALKKLIGELDTCQSDLDRTIRQLKALQEEEARIRPKTCPICRGPMP